MRGPDVDRNDICEDGVVQMMYFKTHPPGPASTGGLGWASGAAHRPPIYHPELSGSSAPLGRDARKDTCRGQTSPHDKDGRVSLLSLGPYFLSFGNTGQIFSCWWKRHDWGAESDWVVELGESVCFRVRLNGKHGFPSANAPLASLVSLGTYQGQQDRENGLPLQSGRASGPSARHL